MQILITSTKNFGGKFGISHKSLSILGYVSLQFEALCLLCRSFVKSLLPTKYNGKSKIHFKQISVNFSSRVLQDTHPKKKIS